MGCKVRKRLKRLKRLKKPKRLRLRRRRRNGRTRGLRSEAKHKPINHLHFDSMSL